MVVKVFDVVELGDFFRYAPSRGTVSLESMLADNATVKVFHDARQDYKALEKNGMQLGKCFDTQIAHEYLTGDSQRGLKHVVNYWLNVQLPDDAEMKQRFKTQNYWMKRPLDATAIEYAAADVQHLPALYDQLAAEATKRDPNGIAEIIRLSTFPRPAKRSKGRLQDTVIAFGQRLKSDDTLRERCGEKVHWKAALDEWKAEERAAGREWTGRHSEVLTRMMRMSKTKCEEFGLLRITISDGIIVFHEARAGAQEVAVNVAYACEQVHQQRERIEADKGGLTVTPVLFDETVSLGGQESRQVTIVNTSGAVVELRSVKLLKSPKMQHPNFSLGQTLDNVYGPMAPGAQKSFTLKCHPMSAGMVRDILSIKFGGEWTIGRYLEARAGDAALLDLLKPSAPYQRRRRPPPQLPTHQLQIDAPPPEAVVGGEDGASTRPQGPKLKGHDVNPNWRGKLKPGGGGAEVLEGGDASLKLLRGPSDDQLALSQYRSHLVNLLWTEEVQLHADLTEFDFVASGRGMTVLTYEGGLHWLRVPGLAENRPSVLRGDKVRARLPSDAPNKRWEGIVMDVRQEEVGLRFSAGFKRLYVDKLRLEVWFVLSRTGMRLFHQGLEQAASKEQGRPLLRASIIFPEPRDVLVGALLPPRAVTPQPLFNRALNAQQVAAVRNICGGNTRRVPYVLFGPPGTGKTTTLAEAITQCAVKLNPKQPPYDQFRILVAAPTNTAADFICEKMSRWLGKGQMLRLVAYSRASASVSPDVLRCSNWNSLERAFEMPPLAALLTPCVVVCTLTTAAKLHNQGVARGHFDMICVDEAGQAIEPELMGPIAPLLGESGQLVVAGDPKQLGPVIHHSLAKEHGLATSYLERLMSRPLYQPARPTAHGAPLEYNQSFITKLLNNYRSHPTLLALPNKLFYDNELVSCADPLLTNCCLRWDGLLKPTVPLLFEGIVGKDQREASSPSWFNGDEATVVLRHVRDLVTSRQLPVAASDIGVVTPYNKQVGRIRMVLGAERSVDLRDVKVGSTELFQGQERKVIIISTVRSSQDYIGFDKKHNLGFLDNPKRFNVAITRAQALLIIVGNPHVLAVDENWRALLRHCIEHGAYKGDPPPPLEPPAATAAAASAAADGGVALSDLEELLAQPSEQMQQEGMEMPSYE